MSRLVHIVDGDAKARAALARALETRGFATRIMRPAPNCFAGSRPKATACSSTSTWRTPEARRSRRRWRGAALPVIVMGGHSDLGAAVRAMKLGAVDFLAKPPRDEELVAAVERAFEASRQREGRRGARTAAAAAVGRLSRRERQILEGLLGGLSNKGIARSLDLSPRTVEMHRANMMTALGTATLPEALRVAIDAGLDPSRPARAALPAAPEIAPLDAPAAEEPEAIRRGYEEKLRLALEASGDGAWDWDIASGRIELSLSLIERIGLSYGDQPNRLDILEERMHPADRDGFHRALDDHLQGRTPAFVCEYRIREREGGWVWTEVRGRVVERDPATGAPLRMLGTARDLTARKAEEVRARQAAELLAVAQAAAGAGTWDIELASGLLHVCARGRELNGLPVQQEDEDDLTLEAWAQSVHPDDIDAVMAAIEAAAASGGSASVEFRVRQPDGRWRRLRAVGKVVEPAQGEPRRLIGLTQAVSEGEQAALGFRGTGEERESVDPERQSG